MLVYLVLVSIINSQDPSLRAPKVLAIDQSPQVWSSSCLEEHSHSRTADSGPHVLDVTVVCIEQDWRDLKP